MTTERWDDERLDRLGDRIERLIDRAFQPYRPFKIFSAVADMKILN